MRRAKLLGNETTNCKYTIQETSTISYFRDSIQRRVRVRARGRCDKTRLSECSLDLQAYPGKYCEKMMGEGDASLLLDRLNCLVSNSSRVGFVLNLFVSDAGVRSARNKLHKYLVCWQEHWGLGCSPSPL